MDFDNQKVHILTNPRGGWRVYSKEDRTEVLRGDPHRHQNHSIGPSISLALDSEALETHFFGSVLS